MSYSAEREKMLADSAGALMAYKPQSVGKTEAGPEILALIARAQATHDKLARAAAAAVEDMPR